MDANAAFDQGNSSFVDEDYDEALEHYNLAVELGYEKGDVYVKRSALHIKLKNYPEAMQDANKAIDLLPSQERAYMHKGMAAFELGEYETAKASFQKGLTTAEAEKKAASQVTKYKTWMRKCDAEIADEDSSDDDDVPVVQDVTTAKTQSKPAVSVSPPKPPQSTPAPSPPVETAASSSNEVEEDVLIPAQTIKYTWYQNDTHVTVSIMKKKLEPSMCKIGIKMDSMCVKVKESDKHEESTVMNLKLFGKIDNMSTVTRFLSSKVELKLKKKQAAQWGDLGAEVKTAKSVILEKDPPKNTPYAGGKDWNQIDKQITADLEKDKPEGEEALNKLFADIYGKATPETRKAMNKSMQTSGGTVLSTNWGEVEKEDYEKTRQAPDGVEWKKWG